MGGEGGWAAPPPLPRGAASAWLAAGGVAAGRAAALRCQVRRRAHPSPLRAHGGSSTGGWPPDCPCCHQNAAGRPHLLDNLGALGALAGGGRPGNHHPEWTCCGCGHLRLQWACCESGQGNLQSCGRAAAATHPHNHAAHPTTMGLGCLCACSHGSVGRSGPGVTGNGRTPGARGHLRLAPLWRCV